MPRVAAAGAVLLVVWLLVRSRGFYRTTPWSVWFGALTFLAVASSTIYYGLRAALWMKRHLLWRVRRRLVITYLFVGLTPIVLLVLLGLLASFGASSQAMARLVAAQIKNTEKEAKESARSLSEAFMRLPGNASDRTVQAWLDEQGALLQASLPGASIALWRGAPGERSAETEWTRPAQFVFTPSAADTRGVGPVAGNVDAPLPEWLNGHDAWSGFAFIRAPAESKKAFGTPSVRALSRTNVGGRDAALLLSVPVSRALIERFRESTGINVRPFFVGEKFNPGDGEDSNVIVVNRPEMSPEVVATQEERTTDGSVGQKKEVNFFADQFGEPFKPTLFVSQPWPVFLPSTNWLTGEHAAHWAFMVDWSWRAAGEQLLGDTTLGERWQQAFFGVAVAFLLLELFALFSAAWMTRAVTGTVHKLSQATEYIKRGDFSHRVRVRSRDQLGELALAFNDMSANVESLLEERVKRERLEREVEIAAEVQSQLFPRRVPDLATVEVAGECRAARGVAGDYYDYIEVAPGLVAFALGDVSGKGISASLVMSNLQAALRAQTAIIAERLRNSHARASAAAAIGGEDNFPRPDAVAAGMIDDNRAVSNMVERINDQLCLSTESNRFATLFLALYDDRARTLRYANAGHNAPMLVRADGSVERLTAGGTMVGAFDWMNFEEAQTTLGAGEVLVIFSDGISEAQNNLGEEYGEERLAQLVLAYKSASAEKLLEVIFDEVDNWSGVEERGDDQTLVIVKGVNGT